MNRPVLSTRLRSWFFGVMLALTALLPFGGATRVTAQDSDYLRLNVEVGFDGYCKQNTWLPVQVEVENSGADLQATVQVSYKNSNNGVTSTRAEVALPATSRKVFHLYLYPQGLLREFQVSVLDGKQPLLTQRVAVNCLGNENMLFGVLADAPATFDVLSDIQPLGGFVRVAQLRAADLPAQAQGWEALDALVISGVDTATLTPEQRQALRNWVGAGGRLLVTGGLRWQGNVVGLGDLLPLEVNSTRSVTGLPALVDYVSGAEGVLDAGTSLSVGPLRAGAEVLVEQGGVPLVIQRTLGFGKVYFLAADPAVSPLSNWGGMTEVYARLLSARPPLPRWLGTSLYDYSANRALGAIAELGLPSIVYIACLLGFYVLIIGPVNFLVLRRLKRREFAWVTIPVLSALFACGAYGAGFLYRGTTPILNRLTLVQAWDGLAQAQAHGWVGIYSPVRTRYDFETAEGFLPLPFGSGNENVQGNNEWYTVQSGDATLLPDVGVEIGGMRPVEVEGNVPALDLTHDLTLRISRTNPTLSGAVRNNSPYTLRQVMLVTPGGWQRLRDLAPGESQSVQVSLALGANGPEFYALDAMTILGLSYTDIQTKVDAARQQAFFETVFTTNYMMNDGNWGIYLFAWLDEPLLPVGLRERKFQSIDTTLYIQQLTPQVQFEPGRVTLPSTLFAWESSSPNATPYYTSSITSGGYVLRFRPAVPVQREAVQSVSLTLQTNTLPNGLVVSAWDYDHRTWVQVARTGGVFDLPDEHFVSPDGEVQFRFVGNQSTWFEIQDSYITMVVEP